jgi:hypothetical protein
MMSETSNVKREMPNWRAQIGNPKHLHCAQAQVSKIAWLAALAIVVTFALLVIATPSQAMPEYATQLGEPCATCHISPAGGGLRSARGQAWVAQEKPGAVPSMEEALKLLGVQTVINPADYAPAPLPRPSPQALNTEESPSKNWHAWLSSYEGN